MLINEEIKAYLREVRKREVMTAKREELLSAKFLNPLTTDSEKENIKREMIEGNLRLVLKLVKRYQNQGLALSDLIAEGNLGLLKAIDNFDWGKNIKFISYASWWVKQSIIQALNEKSRIIRIPTNLIIERRKIKEDIDDLLAFDKLSSNAKLIPSTVRIDDSLNEDNFTLLDIIEDKNSMPSDENLINDNLVKEKLMNLLGILTEKERTIIQDYYGLYGANKNLEDIGYEFNLTRERIRQIKEKALRKLRDQSYEFFQEN